MLWHPGTKKLVLCQGAKKKDNYKIDNFKIDNAKVDNAKIDKILTILYKRVTLHICVH